MRSLYCEHYYDILPICSLLSICACTVFNKFYSMGLNIYDNGIESLL